MVSGAEFQREQKFEIDLMVSLSILLTTFFGFNLFALRVSVFGCCFLIHVF